jgi:hypothetical protein
VTVSQGVVVAVLAGGVTLLAASVAGLCLVVIRIQEERAGRECRPAGCRRSRKGNGCTNGPRVAETARGHITEKE